MHSLSRNRTTCFSFDKYFQQRTGPVSDRSAVSSLELVNQARPVISWRADRQLPIFLWKWPYNYALHSKHNLQQPPKLPLCWHYLRRANETHSFPGNCSNSTMHTTFALVAYMQVNARTASIQRKIIWTNMKYSKLVLPVPVHSFIWHLNGTIMATH